MSGKAISTLYRDGFSIFGGPKWYRLRRKCCVHQSICFVRLFSNCSCHWFYCPHPLEIISRNLLLTLSSIFTRDVAPLFKKAKKETSVAGRIFVVLLSMAGLAPAYSPPATILQIATQTFTGLAVLFPTVIFGLYFK